MDVGTTQYKCKFRQKCVTLKVTKTDHMIYGCCVDSVPVIVNMIINNSLLTELKSQNI